MERYTLTVAFAAVACLACSGGEAVTPETTSADSATVDTVEMIADLVGPDLRATDARDLLDRQTGTDAEPDADTGTGPACAPGEGCFLDPCAENPDCDSGWCVEHMGAGVCTTLCQEECPPGWTCRPVGGQGPDLVFACVSNYSNLCKPCGDSADCKAVGAAEDVCVDYGEAGSFCGGPCQVSDDCPWGFSCVDTQTADGLPTRQCVADSGICPCTGKSVALSLWTPCQVSSEWGTCAGKRVCSHDGLTACDAPQPAPESCDGIDNDCDGDTDEPALVAGKLVELCDDDNECTDDSCLGNDGCQHVALEEGECKDGDSCTIGDHCEGGVCVGTPIDCDDGNPCTDDACDGLGGCQFQQNQADCDDGDSCTVADRCEAGSCAGTHVPCDCQADGDCDTLEDGDVCNGTLVCDLEAWPYNCIVDPATVIDCPGPQGPDAPCLVAACDPKTGACSLAPSNDGGLCDDGDECTVGDTCNAGACQPGAPRNCNDGNPCTDDSCHPASGCLHADNAAPCTDGDVCTLGDQCGGGECQPGVETLACDDGNACTQDSCDAQVGCVHPPADGPCDDGDACTLGDACVGGTCQPGADTLACDDNNPCTQDSCHAVEGCVFKLTQQPCDDGNVCTTGDHCHLGECISSGTLSCSDGNPCTADQCDGDSGCVFPPAQGVCDDGNACTQDDVCLDGKCVGGAVVDCDDGDPCTKDSCTLADGCTHTPATGALCEDGDFCTVGDACVDGQCEPGTPLNCTADNPCVDGACHHGQGCVFTYNEAPCDDADPCTVGDQCVEGKCEPGTQSPDCDDSNPCTQDSCDPDSGCIHPPAEDGTNCGPSHWCQQGECEEIQSGAFCFSGPEKAYMSGEQICQQFYGLPCGPTPALTYHNPDCQGAIHDHGRHCWEMPLDPYDKASALLYCGQ